MGITQGAVRRFNLTESSQGYLGLDLANASYTTIIIHQRSSACNV